MRTKLAISFAKRELFVASSRGIGSAEIRLERIDRVERFSVAIYHELAALATDEDILEPAFSRSFAKLTLSESYWINLILRHFPDGYLTRSTPKDKFSKLMRSNPFQDETVALPLVMIPESFDAEKLKRTADYIERFRALNQGGATLTVQVKETSGSMELKVEADGEVTIASRQNGEALVAHILEGLKRSHRVLRVTDMLFSGISLMTLQSEADESNE